jgi:hypothetical protein
VAGAAIDVLGVRHHGPGSARAVGRALDELEPDCVVIEGAVELDRLVAASGSPDLVPPVAALVYVADDPARATFYPFAAFSPEWVALRWAVRAGVTVRFADLPATNALAEGQRPPRAAARVDPLAALATAAGYDDPERWWEDAVEHRHDRPVSAFAAITEAMASLRERSEEDPSDLVREAAMRRVIRGLRAAHERIAVVCGAWHAPVLVADAFGPATADAARLKGLAKVKVAATWVPWTTGRLARSSGYGAGVTSPGWYAHLFAAGTIGSAGADDDVIGSWLVKVARCLRDEGLPASPAGVVEAVRLASALAVLRGRPLAGLDEVTEAAQAVLCGGSPVPLAVVAERLVVGEELGSVPPDTPMVPLAADLVATAKRLRITRSPVEKTLELDLRTDGGRARSTLFHRLALLPVGWARPAEQGRTLGTFKEAWTLRWDPELEVQLIEASTAGTTVVAAAASTVASRAEAAEDLGELSALVEGCFLADLPGALDPVMAALAERSAHQHDTARLMEAVEPLARTCRYGDVRRRDTDRVRVVLDGLVARCCVGLPAAVAALDDDAADALRPRIDAVQRGLALLDDPELRSRWIDAVARVAAQRDVHGLVAGRLNRLALDAGRLDRPAVADRLARVLSRSAEAPRAAAWLDGFVAGDASLLLHDRDLLGIVDDWVAAIGPDRFDDVLPLLRRTFSAFAPAERRQLGSHLRHAGPRPAGGGGPADEAVDPERAARVLPRVFELLGVER